VSETLDYTAWLRGLRNTNNTASLVATNLLADLRAAEARVRELEAEGQAKLESCIAYAARLAALTEAAREAVAVLTNHDRTTHRGLQWAYDLAAKLRAALEEGK